MKIGLLTGGGDCPGLNAAIRAVVRAAHLHHFKVTGILEGWNGLYQNKYKNLNLEDVCDILALGGTILGGGRVNPLKYSNGIKKILQNFKKQKLDCVISIGGEGTLSIAGKFSEAGMPVICIPKTIDNDAWGTDYTIGFHTAVQIVTDAIDRLHTTAESHNRVMIIEVMGRHAGWIAAYSGIAGGAEAILIPEQPFQIAELCKIVEKRKKRGRYFSIFVVSEDAKVILENGKMLKTPTAKDEYGDVKLGGMGEVLAKALRKRMDSDIRVTILGHVQRGGTPTAYDRMLATCLGVAAVDLVVKKDFGKMVVLNGTQIKSICIESAADKLKTIDPAIMEVAKVFFG